MATTFSAVIENADEQILSTDLNRMQSIASRDAQDVLGNASLRDGFTGFTGTPLKTGSGSSDPVSRADNLGTIVGTTGNFTINMGAGQVFAYLPVGVVDTSAYQVVRWGAGAIGTIVPDSSQVRVDLIYAIPAMVPTDLQSRNLLVNPVARQIAPANVNKTNNPLATIKVLPGTPGSTQAPDCPAGAVPLWEVVTFPGDTDASAYRFVPRIWKRIESFGTCHAILENCVPQMSNDVEPPTEGYRPYLSNPLVHRAIIDGEVICAPLTSATVNGTYIAAEPDTNNDPTAATIHTDKDVFCFLYLCGGRNAPQNGVAGTDLPGGGVRGYHALRLVASLTPPQYNRATAALAIAGVAIPTGATLYAGIWAIAKGTHNYKTCVISGDWVYAATNNMSSSMAGFYESQKSGAEGLVSIQPPMGTDGYPIPTIVDLTARAADSGATSRIVYVASGGTFDATQSQLSVAIPGSTGIFYTARGVCKLPYDGVFCYVGGASTTNIRVYASGYNMNVPRIG
jgi:hypothetical protein